MKFFITLIVSFFCLGCTNHNVSQNKTLVNVQFTPFYKSKVYLEKLSFTGNTETIDSAELGYDNRTLSFTIPHQEESVFQIRIKGEEPRLVFVTDVSVVNIKVERPDWKKYSFKNGGINNDLRSFLDQQNDITKNISVLLKRKTAFQPIPVNSKASDSLDREIKKLQALAKSRDLKFADTVSSPGAFLLVSSRYDFDKDLSAQKDFILRVAKRFPGHSQLQQLIKETMDYISIYEEEYNVGDVLPDVSLPDENGNTVSLGSLRGKYVFIDFWSTWCPPCFQYIDPKKKIGELFPANKMQLVDIAVDAEKEAWQQMISAYRIPGIHLIDEKMWKGTAAQTLKFDSIPFNFFISPEGRILAKGIKTDSVLTLISAFIN